MIACNAITRYVSYLDDSEQPTRLRLAPDQEVVGEEAPEPVSEGRFLRFLFVRGPADQPIRLTKEERLPDGSVVWVRYIPDVDEPCQ